MLKRKEREGEGGDGDEDDDVDLEPRYGIARPLMIDLRSLLNSCLVILKLSLLSMVLE